MLGGERHTAAFINFTRKWRNFPDGMWQTIVCWTRKPDDLLAKSGPADVIRGHVMNINMDGLASKLPTLGQDELNIRLESHLCQFLGKSAFVGSS